MIRYTSLRKYKKHLLRELGPIDEEIRACALFDTEEHLNLLVADIKEKEKGISTRKAFAEAVVCFGYPSEIAEAYRMNL
jgi:hypothetical protein